MKKSVILLILVPLLSSCATYKPSERITESQFLDYRPYSDAGFFISPNPYAGDFTSIGDIQLIIYPATYNDKKNAPKTVKFNDAIYSFREIKYSFLFQEAIDPSELLDALVEKAKAVGANGICNFKCVTIRDNHKNYRKGILSDIYCYQVSGLAIRIPD